MPKILFLIILIFIVGSIAPFIYGAHIAFYLYVIEYFLNPEHRWWSSYIPLLPYSKITALIFLTVFIINYKTYKQNILAKLPPFKWFVLLLIIFMVVNFYALVPEFHMIRSIEFLKMLVILAIAYKVIDSPTKFEWAIYAYILGGLYLAYEINVTGRNSGDRVEGVGLIDAPEANGTAAALVPFIPLLAYYYWIGNKKLRLIVLFVGALIANALVLINSRGAFLGGFAGGSYFAYHLYFSKINERMQKVKVIGLVLLAVIGALSIMDTSFIDRMLTLTDVEDGQVSGSHRIHFWLATFEMLKVYPFGMGDYGYELLSHLYINFVEVLGRDVTAKAVHSIWFQTLAVVGWHGFFVFIMLVISTMKLSTALTKKFTKEIDVRNLYLIRALTAAIYGYLVASTFINMFYVFTLYLLMTFICIMYSIYILQIKKDKSISLN